MKFYVSALVGVKIKVILQNARGNNIDINKILLCRIYFRYVNIMQYLHKGKQSTLRISATTEQRVTTAH